MLAKYMRPQSLPYHIQIGKPPRAIRKAKLDNIALVPASLLFQKGKYQTIANNLPGQGVLICQVCEDAPLFADLVRTVWWQQRCNHLNVQHNLT